MTAVAGTGSRYSINRGLWGITIGGQETLTSQNSIPEDAWVLSPTRSANRSERATHARICEQAYRLRSTVRTIPRRTDRGTRSAGRQLWHRPRHSSRRHGTWHQGSRRIRSTGRDYLDHGASRTRETRAQRTADARQGQHRSDLWRPRARGQTTRPRLRRHRSVTESSQQRVTGTVSFDLRPGNLFIEGVDSPHSLLAATKGVYGESAGEWTAADALATRASCRCRARCKRGQPETHEDASSSTRSPRSHSTATSGTSCGCPPEIPCEEGVLVPCAY